MKHSLIVVDDFMPEPLKLREAVVASEFKPETGHDGYRYAGISRFTDTAVYERLAAALERKIRVDLAFWRLDLAGQFPHSFCHADENCSKFAAILYLNLPEQCFGGTAFWKHIPTGASEMPSNDQIKNAGLDLEKFHEQMSADWKDEKLWAFFGSVAMEFNRCIVYPTNRFHSRHPAEAFGEGTSDGRLVGIIFFDFVPDEPDTTHQ